MTDWITDRLPTNADADLTGDVTVCTSPTLYKESKMDENWRYVTPGWPWRHTEFWTPPTPVPEPTSAALEQEQEQEQEKATRGFAQITTILANEKMELQIAIATDGTAWHRFVVCGEWDKWEQIQPLPQPGEE